MSLAALNFQLTEIYGSVDPLLVYYDFDTGSAFTVQSGSVHQAFLKNQTSGTSSGFFHGKIVGASGNSAATALSLATGVNGFLQSGAGDFTKNNIFISGCENIPLKDCSYLFFIESNLDKDGVIFGSFEKKQEAVGAETVVYSNGFNFGLNSRGNLFFQSLGSDGEYCFVNEGNELSKKNIVALNFKNSETSVFRFDYPNEDSYKGDFVMNANEIQNSSNVYLGGSPTYWRNDIDNKLFSGKIHKFAIISGFVPEEYLFELGKGLVSDYYFVSGSVQSTGVLSGYVQNIVYKTGITGSILEITGYEQIRSGVNVYTQVPVYTGSSSRSEGQRYFVEHGNYVEEIGYLNPANANSYSPTGDGAFATLGLQSSSGVFSGYVLSGSTTYQTVSVPLYKETYLTGVTSEVSGVISSPVYVTEYFTGANNSGIQFTDSFDGFQKNFLYYLGER